MIVYGLRAGWSIKEIMSHEDIKKSTVKRTLGQKEHLQDNCEERGAGGLEIQILHYEEMSIDVRALTGKEEGAGLAQEEPPGGV